jgi:hypothetical protein
MGAPPADRRSRIRGGCEPQPVAGLHHEVLVAADAQDLRHAIATGADHQVAGLAVDDAVFRLQHERRPDQVTLVVGVMEDGVGRADHPVAQHGFAFERDRRERQAAIVVLTRLHLVDGVVGEEFRP